MQLADDCIVHSWQFSNVTWAFNIRVATQTFKFDIFNIRMSFSIYFNSRYLISHSFYCDLCFHKIDIKIGFLSWRHTVIEFYVCVCTCAEWLTLTCFDGWVYRKYSQQIGGRKLLKNTMQHIVCMNRVELLQSDNHTGCIFAFCPAILKNLTFSAPEYTLVHFHCSLCVQPNT